MRSKTLLSALALLIGLAVVLFRQNDSATSADSTAGAPSASVSTTTGSNASKSEAPAAKSGAPAKGTSTIGFGSTRALDEHFEKHGPEFGSVTKAEYLALAQTLRDAP